VGLSPAGDQSPKDHRRGARIVQRGVSRRHVEPELLNKPRQSGRLALGQIEHEPGKGGGVDDRMLKRTLQPTPHQPGVESVMAVLDEHGAMREAQERPTGVAEFGRADQHRTIDVVALFGVRVDRRAAVDQRVEEGKWAGQLESFGAKLENKEWSVAGRLDVDGDELSVIQRGLWPELRRVDGNLLPWDRLRGSARLEEDRFHDCRLIAARRN
jgi:hypothetical protein